MFSCGMYIDSCTKLFFFFCEMFIDSRGKFHCFPMNGCVDRSTKCYCFSMKYLFILVRILLLSYKCLLLGAFLVFLRNVY